MKVYELPISSNYIHTWTVVDAVREIVQNAIDSNTDGNPMKISYNDGLLSVSNYGCTLNISSLVLGNSGKDDQTKYIGTYGEGFKLALIVLVRNGLDVNIYTNGKKWTPSFRKSSKFGIETLHIDVDQDASHNKEIILFEVSGLDYDTYETIRDQNLAILKAVGFNVGESIETEYGDILLDKKYKGMMFVNGLYVQTDSSFQYGYDFKPEYLHLDRDRKAINYYKMRELTAKAVTSQSNVQLVSTAISKSFVDVRDIVEYMDSVSQEFKVNFADHFIKEHELDEDTFVGLKKEVEFAKKEKSFVTESKAVAELVNAGLGKKQEYETIKKEVEHSTKKEQAYNAYDGSSYKDLIDFLVDKKDRFSEDEIEDLKDILDKYSFTTSYFEEIKDEVFDQFNSEVEENDEE